MHISIPVETIAISDGVGLQEAAEGRAVITRPVIIKPGFRIEPAAGITERITAGAFLAADPIGGIGIGADLNRLTKVITKADGQGDDTAPLGRGRAAMVLGRISLVALLLVSFAKNLQIGLWPLCEDQILDPAHKV